MKNVYKVLGIIALVVMAGFSFTACSNGSTGGGTYTGGDTYKCGAFEISKTDFDNIMTELGYDGVGPTDLIYASYDDAMRAWNRFMQDDPLMDWGLAETIPIMQEYLRGYDVTEEELDMATNALINNGFALVGKDNGGDMYGIGGALKN